MSEPTRTVEAALGRERRAEITPGMRESGKRTILAAMLLASQACDVFMPTPYEHSTQHSTESVKKETPEERDRKQFKAELARLEAAGYSIDISKLSYKVIGPAEGLSLGDLNGVSEFVDELEFDIDSTFSADVTPLAALKRVEHDPLSGKNVEVPVYQLTLTVGGDTIQIGLTNWLSDKTVATTRLNFAEFKDTDYDKRTSYVNGVLDNVYKAYQEDLRVLGDTYGRVLTEHGVSVNAMDIARYTEGKGMEQIKALTEDDFIVVFNGFKHDLRTANSPVVSWQFDQYEAMPTSGTPQLDGTLTSVILTRSSNEQPEWWNKKLTQIDTDAFGNTIVTEWMKEEDKYDQDGDGYLYREVISVSTPTAFVDQQDTSEWRGWSVDLSSIGLPKLDQVMMVRPEKPTATIDAGLLKYQVYYEGNDALTEEQGVYTRFFDSVADGASDVQHAFYGYDADQQVVHNILIVPSGEKNGYFQTRNSATIAVTSEHMSLMGDNTTAQAYSVGRHETVHALFNHLGLERNNALTELHGQLSSAFFDAIAEKHWQDDGFGGHAGDNTSELMATFLNTLFSHDFEERIRIKLTPETAADYAKAAHVFRTELKKLLVRQNDQYEPIEILDKLEQAERIASLIAQGK